MVASLTQGNDMRVLFSIDNYKTQVNNSSKIILHKNEMIDENKIHLVSVKRKKSTSISEADILNLFCSNLKSILNLFPNVPYSTCQGMIDDVKIDIDFLIANYKKLQDFKVKSNLSVTNKIRLECLKLMFDIIRESEKIIANYHYDNMTDEYFETLKKEIKNNPNNKMIPVNSINDLFN